MKNILFIIVFLSIVSSNVSSQVLLDENFDYPYTGDSTTIASYGWNVFSSTLNPIKVSTPGLTYSGYLLSGIGNAVKLDSTGQDAYRNLSASMDSNNSGAAYMSFLVKVSSAKTIGTYVTGMLDSGSTSNFRGRLYVKDSLGNVRFGVTKSAEGDTSVSFNYWSTNNYSYNTTYLIIIKYKFNSGSNNDPVSLFVFSSGLPTTEPAPTLGPLTFPSSDAGKIGRVFLRQGENTRGPKLTLDGIRTAKSWSSIVNQIDSFEVGNIYAKGTVPTGFGYPDTFKVQITRKLGGKRPITVKTTVFNDSLGGNQKSVSYQDIPDTTPYAKDIEIVVQDPLTLKTDVIIVEVVAGEFIYDPIKDDTTNNKKSKCRNTSQGIFNQADPCLISNIPLGFNGGTGNLLSAFRNQSNQTYYINKVDHCIRSSTDGGTRPYKIVIYGDNGNGKPGPLLYLSSTLFPPNGANVPTHVIHNLSSAVGISGGNRFYVGYRQTSVNNIYACTQSETPVRDSTFFFSSPDTSNVWSDFHDANVNNVLDIAVISTGSSLNLKAVLQGFYDIDLNSMNRKDTVSVFLRNVVSPYNRVDSARAVIDNLTFTGTFTFYNAPTGTYYFEIKHRNAIETWSKSGGESFTSGGTLSYDFTNSATKAFGNNLILIGSVFTIFNGDVNQDGSVDLTDITLVFNDASSFVYGYLRTDINGDDLIDLTDLTLTFNNSISFVAKITPP